MHCWGGAWAYAPVIYRGPVLKTETGPHARVQGGSGPLQFRKDSSNPASDSGDGGKHYGWDLDDGGVIAMMAEATEFSYKNHRIRIVPYEPISGQWIADIKVFSPTPGGVIE